MKYKGISVKLESSISPGAHHNEEVSITLKSGDKIIANNFCHWHDSCGVFIQHSNGTTSQFPVDQDKTTYALQIEHVQNFKKTLENNPDAV